MLIPVSSLIDLRYVYRLQQSTLELLDSQLAGVPADLDAATTILGRIIDGYQETYKLLDWIESTENGMGP